MNAQTERYPFPSSVSRGQMVFALLGGLVAWALHLITVYGPVSFACQRNALMGRVAGLTTLQVIQLVATIVAAVIVLGAALTALQGWRRLRDEANGQSFVMNGSPYPFLMFVGFLLNGLFLLSIIASLLPILIIEPCALQIVSGS